MFPQAHSGPADGVSEKGSCALLKSVLEALSGQTLAWGPRHSGPGFQEERICSFVEQEQSGPGVKGGLVGLSTVWVKVKQRSPMNCGP